MRAAPAASCGGSDLVSVSAGRVVPVEVRAAVVAQADLGHGRGLQRDEVGAAAAFAHGRVAEAR